MKMSQEREFTGHQMCLLCFTFKVSEANTAKYQNWVIDP